MSNAVNHENDKYAEDTTSSNITTPKDEWNETWNLFWQSIQDIDKEFDQFYWLRRLSQAALNYILSLLHLKSTLEAIKFQSKSLTQFIPFVACCLIVSIGACYFLILHDYVIIQRWCDSDIHSLEECHDDQCIWKYFHAAVVSYLIIMILWWYTQTVFSSPGIVVPTIHNSDEGNDHHRQSNNLKMSSTNSSKTIQWKSSDARGGCCFINVNLDKDAEESRVSFYTVFDENISDNACDSYDGIMYVPSTKQSYCKKCRMYRPPRCHHCSVCNRCVLQMDHHCLWMNNCIGLNNYRSYCLTLVYLCIGMIYGIIILVAPFYESIQQQIQADGWRIMYSHGTGFLNLPPPIAMWAEIRSTGTLNPNIVIKIVFPFLIGVCCLLLPLLFSHLRLICKAVTTLEHLATLQVQKSQSLESLQQSKVNQPLSNATKDMKIVNPFNQGIFLNFCQVFGDNLFYCMLPMNVDLPRPYVPAQKQKSS